MAGSFPTAWSFDGVATSAHLSSRSGLSASTGQYLPRSPAVPAQQSQLAFGRFGVPGSYPPNVIGAVAERCRNIGLSAQPSICSKIIEFVAMVAVMGKNVC